jgi:hypothetical protein
MGIACAVFAVELHEDDCFEAVNLRCWRAALGRVHPVARDCFRVTQPQGQLLGGELGSGWVMCRPTRDIGPTRLTSAEHSSVKPYAQVGTCQRRSRSRVIPAGSTTQLPQVHPSKFLGCPGRQLVVDCPRFLAQP